MVQAGSGSSVETAPLSLVSRSHGALLIDCCAVDPMDCKVERCSALFFAGRHGAVWLCLTAVAIRWEGVSTLRRKGEDHVFLSPPLWTPVAPTCRRLASAVAVSWAHRESSSCCLVGAICSSRCRQQHRPAGETKRFSTTPVPGSSPTRAAPPAPEEQVRHVASP